MTILLDRMPPDGVEALEIWVREIIEARANRPPGAELPFCMLTRPTVVDDKITETGTYRTQTFAAATDTKSALLAARDAAYDVHRRILVMGPPMAWQQPITLSDGKVVQCDGVSTLQGPTWEKYTEDGSIESFIAEYTIDWRFIAA